VIERLDRWLEGIIEYSSTDAPIDFVLILSHWDVFLIGAQNTLMLVGLALAIGAAVALPLSIVRTYSDGIASRAIGVYVYVFRGTPLLVQAYLIYYGLGQFAFVRDSLAWTVLESAWWCALIAFTLNTVAYQIEIFRGGLQAVPRGEMEAAKAYGMSRLKAIRRIAIPSGLRRSLPMLLNEIIFMIHGSVVASTLTVIDILGAGRMLNGRYYLAYEGFLAASLIYMAIILTLTAIFRRIERRTTRHLGRQRPQTAAGLPG